MGATQSGQPRTVHMDNDTPIGVIDVSDAVVQRLKSGMIKASETTKREERPSSLPSSAAASAGTTSSSPQLQPIETKQNVPSSYPNPYPPPGIIYAEPTITASDVRRQKEAELTQNDLYWRKRLQQLEQSLSKTNAVMEKEYSAAIDDVRKRFHNAPAIHQLPPCQDLKAQLIACYRSNSGETLNCSEEVAAFIKCVGENRIKKLDQADVAATGATSTDAGKAKQPTSNANKATK